MEMNMKMLFAALAVAAAVATPAFAQSYNPNFGSGNIVPHYGYRYGGGYRAYHGGYGAYARGGYGHRTYNSGHYRSYRRGW
jgi:hypothetical protein